MVALEEETEIVLGMMEDISRYLVREDKRKRAPTALRKELQRCVERTAYMLDRAGDRLSRYELEEMHRRLESTITVGTAKDITSELRRFLLSSRGRLGASILERRIEELLQEVRRMAKLQEEWRTSPTISEKGEKKKEDILKKYKSAKWKIFVIMPFSPKFDDVWKGGIERACSAGSFGCLRVDKVSLSTWITEDMKKYMKMADVVIADITGNNPNVMFELGWALALGKQPIVIRQKEDPEQVPFDVKDIRYIRYSNTWRGIEELHRKIGEFAKSTSETLNEKTKKSKES